MLRGLLIVAVLCLPACIMPTCHPAGDGLRWHAAGSFEALSHDPSGGAPVYAWDFQLLPWVAEGETMFESRWGGSDVRIDRILWQDEAPSSEADLGRSDAIEIVGDGMGGARISGYFAAGLPDPEVASKLEGVLGRLTRDSIEDTVAEFLASRSDKTLPGMGQANYAGRDLDFFLVSGVDASNLDAWLEQVSTEQYDEWRSPGIVTIAQAHTLLRFNVPFFEVDGEHEGSKWKFIVDELDEALFWVQKGGDGSESIAPAAWQTIGHEPHGWKSARHIDVGCDDQAVGPFT